MSEPQYNLEQLNVVIVDDNKNMRDLVESILFALGVKHIHGFADAMQAYRALYHFPADIIITDWHMDPIDGIELVRMIRKAEDSPNPYVPIIMLTGHSELKRVIDARDSGVNEFLAKPIAAKGLYQRIVSIIENPRPFIRTKTYFGPCRRRKDKGPPKGMRERRREELEKIVEAEGITAAELEELLRS